MLATIIFAGVLPIPGNATERPLETVYYDDGSYMTVEIITNMARTTWSVTGSKQYTYYDGNSVSQWKAVLTGTFTYDGSSSNCTSSNVDVTIYDSSWYVISQFASKTGNKANASVTMGEKLVGGTVTRVPVNLSLECDANGNLS